MKKSDGTHEHNGIKGAIRISESESKYSGEWYCEKCGGSNSSIGISDNFNKTLNASKNGFEKHVNHDCV
jgi:hypothetical protein